MCMYHQNKTQILSFLKETIKQYQMFVQETNGDLFWKNALNDIQKEYELTQDLPDDEFFAENRSNLLLTSGLWEAGQRRLENWNSSV